MHGDRDAVVPYRFGEKIFATAKDPKVFLPIPGGQHINSMMVESGRYRKNLLKFLDDAG